MAELKGYRLGSIDLAGALAKLAVPKGVLAPKGMKVEGLIARCGTEIWCPNKDCNVRIGQFKRDLYTHTTVAYDTIDYEPAQRREAGQHAACKLCGTGYLQIKASMSGSRIWVHTRLGWM